MSEATVTIMAAPTTLGTPPLKGISGIRTFFRTNQQPIYFIGPTAFNLLGIDRWVRNFQYIAYYDSWDGAHPRVFTPKHRPYIEFKSSEHIINYLLRDPEVQAHIKRRGGTPMVAMVFFDEETEQICKELGYELILPPDELRTTPRLEDHHDATGKRGWRAVGAERTRAGQHLRRAYGARRAQQAGHGPRGPDPIRTLGQDDLLHQVRKDWQKSEKEIVGQDVKVMKRINHKAAAVEACITRHGTVVGPFMSDLTGYPELTPYQGGWCGNDLFPDALSEAHRATAVEHVRRLGDRL